MALRPPKATEIFKNELEKENEVVLGVRVRMHANLRPFSFGSKGREWFVAAMSLYHVGGEHPLAFVRELSMFYSV